MHTDQATKGSWTYRLSDTVEALDGQWHSCSGDDVFFSKEFLSCVEGDRLPTVRQYYLEVFHHSELSFCLVLQVKRFALRDSLRIYDEAGTLAARLSGRIKAFCARWVNFNFLVVGNLLLTGQFGVAGKPVHEEAVEDAINAAVDLLQQRGIKIPGMLRKDYDEGAFDDHQRYGYTQFAVQPTMYLHIDSSWKTMDDYLAAMKSKYRVRSRKALKLIAPVNKKILSTSDIAAHEEVIHQLYRSVSSGAGFNMFILPKDYFLNLNKSLGDRVEVIGYFLEDRLIGFYTAIRHGDHLDAHFLGYDPTCNQRLKLYFNMLLGLTSYAIDEGLTGVMMSRTAMEIKSSVGATPTNQYLYVKARNSMINRILPPVLDYFVPEDQWVQRHPFRD